MWESVEQESVPFLNITNALYSLVPRPINPKLRSIFLRSILFRYIFHLLVLDLFENLKTLKFT